MKSNGKIFLLILLAILFFYINYRYRNIFIRTYNWISGVPKMLIVFFTIVALIAPALLKNNTIISYFGDYLPFKPKTVNTMPKKPIPPITGGRRVPTSKIRKVSEQLKKSVAANQRWLCAICGELLQATYEVDHILALENGGDNNVKNLQALCRNCHGKKTMNDNLTRRYPNGKIMK